MRIAYTLMIVGCMLAVAFALPPCFDAREVVRRVRGGVCPASGEKQGSDDGEFLVDTSITYIRASSYQFDPTVAFGSTNYLVVWEDARNGETDIYGCRVTPDGIALDPSGIPISTAENYQFCPAVSFDGANFLVVWQDSRSGYEIYGCRVTPDGAILDSLGIPISTAGLSQCMPAVSFDGTDFLVVWEDGRNGSGSLDVYGCRVTPAGSVLDTLGIAISTAEGRQESPAVSFDGAHFLVVWADERGGYVSDIYGCRVTSTGAVLDPSGIPISTAPYTQESPAVSSDGTNSLVTWGDRRSGNGCDIYGSRVTPAGSVLDTSGIPISRALYDQQGSAVSFDGANFLVTWVDCRNNRDTSDVYGCRVTPTGGVLDTSGFAISTAARDQQVPAISFDGTSYLVVWQDYRNNLDTSDIYGSRVTPAGDVLDSTGVVISFVANMQRSPAVSSDGTNFLVVWEDERRCSHGIYGTRVTPAGTVLDPSAIAISAVANEQSCPAVSFDGANFLVVWQESRSGSDYDIYGSRLTPDGDVLDSAGFPISAAAEWQVYPKVSFDGTNYLVVWQDYRGDQTDVYGCRVTPEGIALDPSGIVIATAPHFQYFPAVSFDGTNFLVVWQDQRSGSYDIYGCRVTSAGTVLDPSGIATSTAAGYQEFPAVSFDGTHSLVVWGDERGGSSHDIYGCRVTPVGVVLDPSGIPISAESEEQWFPAVTFDGTNFLVAWEHRLGGGTDIYGCRVTPAGAVLDSGPIVKQAGHQLAPVLACGPGSQMFLAYHGWTEKAGGSACNTYRVWAKMDPCVSVGERSQLPMAPKRITAPTVVRGAIHLSGYPELRSASWELLDISGRNVLDLHPGKNDVGRLSPGVYFVREANAQAQAQAVSKVVVAR